MIWLYIYIGTVIFYWTSSIALAFELDGYVKRMNLTIEKLSTGERVSGWIKGVVVSLIPVVNLILGFMFLFSQSIRDSAIKKMRSKDSGTSWEEFCKD